LIFVGCLVISNHKQKWAKVNAPVDADIVGLIEALSAFPCLETIESCQGDSKTSAWVCFTYGRYWEHHWRDISKFVFEFLGPGLATEVGDDATVSIRLTGSNTALCHLTVRPGAINRTTKALKRLRKNFVS